MIPIIGYELKKILLHKIVIGSILGLLLVCFILLQAYCFNTPTNTVITTEGTQLFGRDAITYNQSIAKRYAGEFTDKTIARMMQDFKEEYPKEYKKMRTSGSLSARIPSAYLFLPLFLSPDQETTSDSNQSTHPSFTPTLTEDGLISIHEVGDYTTNPPYHYDYSDSWFYFFSACCGPNFAIAIPVYIVIIIASSGVFSGEYSTKTSSLLLTTRYGKNKLILGKILASMIFATLLLGGTFLLFTVTFGIHYGFQGWNAAIQTNFGLSLMRLPIAMNHLQLLLLSFTILWFAAMFVVATTLMISAVMKSPFSSLVLTFLVFILPRILRQVGTHGVLHDLLLLFPIQLANVQEVLRVHLTEQSIYHGNLIHSLLWIGLASVLVMFVSSGLTYRAFTNNEMP